MSGHFDRDAQEYDPTKMRPKDLDEALLTDGEKRLDRASNNMENAERLTKPIVAIIVALVMGGVWFGSFYNDYKYNAENGSPAIRKLMAGQQEQIANQQTQISQLSYIVADLKRRQDRDDDFRGKP